MQKKQMLGEKARDSMSEQTKPQNHTGENDENTGGAAQQTCHCALIYYQFAYAKYGAVSKSMLIINEAKAVSKLSKSAVRNAFEEALKTA